MVELYCDLDGLQAPGGRSIPADVMVEAQRPDIFIVHQSVHGRHRIALVELIFPWDTDAKRADDERRQQDFSGVFICHILGSQ
jgi:hypothetical protein